MATETILGNDTALSSSTVVGNAYGSVGMLFTAAWAGGATSVLCTLGHVRFGAWDLNPINVKMLVWSNANVLLGVSSPVSTNPSVDTWYDFTFAGVTIAKGSSYRLGFVMDGDSHRFCCSGTGSQPEYTQNTGEYATPANWTGAAGNFGGTTFAGYLEADTAGGGGGAPASQGRRIFVLP